MLLNYPKYLLRHLKEKNIWFYSVLNFSIFNVIYFIHNLIENHASGSIVQKTILDQMYLLIYYAIVIALFAFLANIIKVQLSFLKIIQYLFAVSIIFIIIYIADIPILLLDYNVDIFFRITEFAIYCWLSWELLNHYYNGKNLYFALLGLVSIFYFTFVIRSFILFGLYIRGRLGGLGSDLTY